MVIQQYAIIKVANMETTISGSGLDTFSNN